MKLLQKIVTMTSMMALLTTSCYSQEDQIYSGYDFDDSYAYSESGQASQLSSYVPLGVLVATGIAIAVIDRHHGGGGHGGRRHRRHRSSYSSTNGNDPGVLITHAHSH